LGNKRWFSCPPTDSIFLFGKAIEHQISGTVREIGTKAFSFHGRLIDLSFEEGTERIGAFALMRCYNLKNAAFPASLIAIGENAFEECRSLCHITFGVDLQLQCIRKSILLLFAIRSGTIVYHLKAQRSFVLIPNSFVLSIRVFYFVLFHRRSKFSSNQTFK
jgi:hypothetical protein